MIPSKRIASLNAFFEKQRPLRQTGKKTKPFVNQARWCHLYTVLYSCLENASIAIPMRRPSRLPSKRLQLSSSAPKHEPAPTTRSSKQPSASSATVTAPLPYAARADMYDDYWVTKQERAFTKWLNYELTDPDVPPTLGQTAFVHYTSRLETEYIRRHAAQLYQSDAFVLVTRRIDEVRDQIQDSRTTLVFMPYVGNFDRPFVIEGRLQFI